MANKKYAKYSRGSKAKDYYYNKAGRRVPAVSTVLNLRHKQALIHWAWDLGMKNIDYRTHRDDLANVGKLAHEMIHLYFRGEDPTTLFEHFKDWEVRLAKISFQKFEDWLKAHTVEPIFLEHKLVSEDHQCGGRPDLIARVDGLVEVDDFKTGKSVYQEHKYQIAAYGAFVQELEGIEIERYRLINIPRGERDRFEDFTILASDIELYFKGFRALLDLYRCERALGVDYYS